MSHFLFDRIEIVLVDSAQFSCVYYLCQVKKLATVKLQLQCDNVIILCIVVLEPCTEEVLDLLELPLQQRELSTY